MSIATLRASLQTTIVQAGKALLDNTANKWSEEDLTVFADSVAAILAQEGKSKQVTQPVVEEIVCKVLLHILDQTMINENPSYNPLCSFLHFLLLIDEKGCCEEALPMNSILISMESVPMTGCRQVFSLLDSHSARFTQNMNPVRGKGPALLRTLNELVRRLSRSRNEDAIFAGKINMLLSRAFALGDKSGANFSGNFNTENVTVLEPKSNDAVMQNDEDTDFYETFWSLQKIFTNPPLLFTSTEPPTDFATLKSSIEKTLEIFTEETKKEKAVAGSKSEESEQTDMTSYFFPKFLTSRNLLTFELSDANFRRQILVQILILIDYLKLYTSEHKAKREKYQIKMGQHSVSDEIAEWLGLLRKQTASQIDSMSGGTAFLKNVEMILARETNWIEWKLHSCAPFEKDPLNGDIREKIKSKQRVLIRPPKPYMHAVGSAGLSYIWRSILKLEDCTPKNPKVTLEELAAKWNAQETKIAKLQEENKIDELHKAKEISQAIEWRAIKLASLSHWHLFNKIGDGNFRKLLDAIEESKLAVKEPRSDTPGHADYVSSPKRPATELAEAPPSKKPREDTIID